MLTRIFLLILFIYPFIKGQTDTLKITNDDFIRIDSIKIMGNEVTEDFVILRELTFNADDEINLEQLNYNRERIFSLGLFNKVDILLTQNSKIITAQIIVKETWYIFPLPYFENKGADFKRMRIGLYLLYKNFRGRNETISSKIGFGYDPFYSVTFQSPLLFEGSDLQFSAGIINMKVSNKSEALKRILYSEDKDNFDYRAISSFVNFGKRIDEFNRFYFSAAFSYYELPFEMEKSNASDGRIDRIISAGLTYEFDSRDLVQNPSEGTYFTTSFVHNGFGIEDVSINKLTLDYRKYIKISKSISAKSRVYLRNLYGSNIPYYFYSYLGINEFVRGHKNDQEEGKNMVFGSVELNYSILKEWIFSVKLPLLPRKLTTYRIGITAKLFADFGTVYNSYKKLYFNGFESGYGGGLLLLVLPHKAFRFEYAINKYGKGEFIFGAGFSF